jgi:CubicO group peptidase (beta-lactamase class C family)
VVDRALAAVDALAREECARWGVPGLTLGVLADGATAIQAWGVGSLAGDDEPLAPEATFRIASVTKPFTAALAEAVLDLDEPLATPAGPATPRQLLSHLGGLLCEAERPLASFASVSDAVAGAGLRAFGRPGELWVYSNAGYWLVGAEIERVTGSSFEDAMREQVLQPRGLAGIGFGPPSTVGHEPVAPGAVEHRVYPVPDYPVARRPSGGLVAGVADLLQFVTGFWDGVVATTVRPGGEQAPGWMIERRGDRIVVHHPGSAAGFQSILALVPDRRVAVAALANSARGSAAFTPVVDALLEALADVPPWSPSLVELAPEELEALAGRYAGPDEEVVVAVRGPALGVRLAERDPFTGETTAFPELLGLPTSARSFAVLEGEAAGSSFDFPGSRFRMGSVLADRVS